MDDIVLVGYGGHAKSVADCIERQGKFRIVGYTELHRQESRYPYLGTDAELDTIYTKGIRNAFVCIGYLGKSNIRERLYDQLKSIGYELPVIIDPSAIVSDTAKIGTGTFVGKNAVINAEANIGKMTIINTMTLIEHDCVIGDYSHIAVGATLCGAVTVGRGCLIGANATIIQTLRIGDYSLVGAGTVICKDVAANTTVYSSCKNVIAENGD